MKSKDSPTLYDILKSASGPAVETEVVPPPPKPPEAPAGPTLQDRLAAYKAAKTGLSECPAAVPPPAPAALTAPAAVLPERPAGPGERVLRLTYNTIAFLMLVILGLVFLSYAIGLRAGRSGAADASAAKAPAILSDPVAAPAPSPKVHAIRLIEWAGNTSQERVQAQVAAGKLVQALGKAGFKGAETMLIRRGAEKRVALYLERFTDRASAEARARLAAVRKFTFQNQAVFAKADFEEVPK